MEMKNRRITIAVLVALCLGDVSSHREWTSGSTAYGQATFTGPDGRSRPVDLSLTCDKNGSVS